MARLYHAVAVAFIAAGCARREEPPAPASPPPCDLAAAPAPTGPRWIRFAWGGVERQILPAHSREEVDRREAAFAEECARLPPSLAAIARPRLRLLATVSVAEGDFDGIATHRGDPAASVGIFQWATTRHRPDAAGSSLAWFFASVRARAASEPLAAAAWSEARSAGIDLRAGALRLDGKPAAGALLEQRLAPVMGRGALRTWQLVAANAAVDRIAARRVAGRRVDAIFPSARGLATAVLLGVNRPAWVVPCLEAALRESPGTDEESLLAAFRRAAIARYPAAQQERRAMRLFTSESL